MPSRNPEFPTPEEAYQDIIRFEGLECMRQGCRVAISRNPLTGNLVVSIQGQAREIPLGPYSERQGQVVSSLAKFVEKAFSPKHSDLFPGRLRAPIGMGGPRIPRREFIP